MASIINMTVGQQTSKLNILDIPEHCHISSVFSFYKALKTLFCEDPHVEIEGWGVTVYIDRRSVVVIRYSFYNPGAGHAHVPLPEAFGW